MVTIGGEIPVLLAHPDGFGGEARAAPTCLWLHGRTVYKELDPGRYLRWLRAGIATCAIDLAGHGDREDKSLQQPTRTLDVLEQTIMDVDTVVNALSEGELRGWFDLDRLAIAGMSAGGMAALRRLCDDHPFKAAAVEATTGWLTELYYPTLEGHGGAPWGVEHPRDRLARLDPIEHLDGWRTIPMLALHSEADEMVPWASQRVFLERLREHYAAVGADPGLVEVHTWAQTGAPSEHIGFGKFAAEAKDLQTEFLTRALQPNVG